MNASWWAALGGLVGAVQVYACLTLVHKVGAGPFVGITATAALVNTMISYIHFGDLPINGRHRPSWRQRERAAQ